jgi:serine phosphatase RsbU (regulator of sigma subunit)
MNFEQIDNYLYEAWTNRRSDMRQSYHAAQQLIKKCEELNYKRGLADCNKILGYCYWRFTEFSLSMEHSLAALQFYRETNDLRGEADTLNSLGAVYMFQKDNEKRLDCNLKCLEIRREIGDADDISGSMNNIGETYFEMGNLDAAKDWFEQCINYPGSTKDSIAWAYHNLGKLKHKEGAYQDSEAFYLKSLDQSRLISYDVLTTESLLMLSRLYADLNRVELAIDTIQETIQLAEQIGSREELKEAYVILAKLYESSGNFELALIAYKKYHQLYSEIHNEANIQRLKDIEFQYELESAKKEAEIERLKTVELRKAYDQIEQQKELLEYQNKEILDSIRYAQRIQKALLKEESHVSLHLPEHFILYKPKDIVSGDFYWAHEKNGVLYVAAADCTGHGVPGGFLTMLGIAFLNEIISKNELKTPAEILNELREKFIQELHLHHSAHDGMDIALIRLSYDQNGDNKEVIWAGAHNPLWVVKSGGNDYVGEQTIMEILPDKQPIGLSDDMRKFTDHRLELVKGDKLYLFSDGYHDQFGGDDGKKLKKSGFKDVLLSVSQLAMDDQLNALSAFFEDWKGKNEQVDDVCVIGIEL